MGTAFDPVMFVGVTLVFAVVACVMLFAPLVIGRFLRPNLPIAEKLTPYECGEPTIGTTNIQFDLRFYVVALLFIVFDVEVAFFFPWAVVFGKASALANVNLTEPQRQHVSAALLDQPGRPTPAPMVSLEAAGKLQRIAFADLLVFFGVVLVGFAYIWKRGDLDWVRSVAEQRAADHALATQPPGRAVGAPTPVLKA